jgi:hypothetical protein
MERLAQALVRGLRGEMPGPTCGTTAGTFCQVPPPS